MYNSKTQFTRRLAKRNLTVDNGLNKLVCYINRYNVNNRKTVETP